MARAKKEQPAFEELLRQLEQSVTELEQGQLTLEAMLQKYGEGIELVKACQILLQQAEQQLPRDTQEDSIWN